MRARRCRKLIRDKLEHHVPPERLSTAKPEELEQLLLDKILEEAQELAETGDPMEAADLLEALNEWLRLRGMTLRALQELADEKRERRGGFRKRLVLDLCNE